MRKVCLFLLVGFLWLKGSSQPEKKFADSTSQWTVLASGWSFDWGAYQYRLFYSVTGNTIISNREYQVISESTDNTRTRFIRMDSLGRVWMLIPNDTFEYPLYDFQKISGDTFYSTVDEFVNWKDSLCVIVDSVDSLYLDKWRARMFVHGQTLHNSGCQCQNDVLVEGIGSLNKYLFGPLCNLASTDDVTFDLLCYQEHGQLLYVNPMHNNCILGIENDGVEYGFQIFPNPSTTSFTLQLSSPLTAQTYFQLYDALGRPVMRETVNTETTTLQRGNLPTGIYFWQLVQGNKILGRGKVVME